MNAKTIKSLLLAGVVVLLGGAIDLYLVTLADRWAVRTVGEVGELYSASLLFVPKLIFGLATGFVVELVACKFALRHLRRLVTFGFIVYFVWKFKTVEVWIAPQILAYVLAVGPYVAFFVALYVPWLSRRLCTLRESPR